MDIQAQSQQPISDDQELAKVLAGVKDEADAAETPAIETPTPAVPTTPMPTADDVAAAATTPVTEEPADPAVPEIAMPDPITPTMPQMPGVGGDDLGGIKQEAIIELRPLVDKLDLTPEEKFDTYLLILRSTDDKALVAPAHEAAKLITDEERKAKALLEIIKEIDFLSNN